MEQPHQLEHLWTFWFDNPSAKSKHATWGSSMRAIYTFSTVEQFWSYVIVKECCLCCCHSSTFFYYSLYNNIHHPSKLAVGADFHCFKYKIEPKWEDPVCANGGKWSITFHRGKSDRCWLYTVSFRALVYT
ncbi:hypothetical protein Goari_008920 [Gossypium aridum]|uniref:Eukaryotic translation initiation factor 4E-1 n=1 Tax=Gossypium aridum TaxID=34290 RepID=A0A7J8XVD1_GOSAI|nr:hypothetical protein [Gossypium aridum]